MNAFIHEKSKASDIVVVSKTAFEAQVDRVISVSYAPIERVGAVVRYLWCQANHPLTLRRATIISGFRSLGS